MEKRRGGGVVTTPEYISSSSSGLKVKTDTSTDAGRYPSELKYANTMLLSVMPCMVVIAGFGGRPTLIAACFGGIVAYIFDLVGTIEVR
jgi:hypothetical protein